MTVSADIGGQGGTEQFRMLWSYNENGGLQARILESSVLRRKDKEQAKEEEWSQWMV